MTAQGDMFSKSSFMYIDSDSNGNLGRKLYKGPPWDYDFTIDWQDKGLFCEWTNNYNAIWAPQLLTKGDFLAELYNLSEGELRDTWEKLIDEKFQVFVNNIWESEYMDSIKWPDEYYRSFDETVEFLKQFYNERFNWWYDELWDESKLLGLVISRNEDILVSKIDGTPLELQWYKIVHDLANNEYHFEAVEGETRESILPKSNGAYCLVAKGRNIAYSEYANENYEAYCSNGAFKLLTLPEIDIYSNVILYTN